jgi:hypothetical protein
MISGFAVRAYTATRHARHESAHAVRAYTATRQFPIPGIIPRDFGRFSDYFILEYLGVVVVAPCHHASRCACPHKKTTNIIYYFKHLCHCLTPKGL